MRGPHQQDMSTHAGPWEARLGPYSQVSALSVEMLGGKLPLKRLPERDLSQPRASGMPEAAMQLEGGDAQSSQLRQRQSTCSDRPV